MISAGNGLKNLKVRGAQPGGDADRSRAEQRQRAERERAEAEKRRLQRELNAERAKNRYAPPAQTGAGQCQSQIDAARAIGQETQKKLDHCSDRKEEAQAALTQARDCFLDEAAPERKLKCLEKALDIEAYRNNRPTDTPPEPATAKP